MEAIINTTLRAVWPQLSARRSYQTPDNSVSKAFDVTNSTEDFIAIRTDGGSTLNIYRPAFGAALRYLLENRHVAGNPCEIRSNQIANEAGPLCIATRSVNNGTRVINYIAPLLENVGIVATQGTRPNLIWLA
jgi:hypothetical protein